MVYYFYTHTHFAGDWLWTAAPKPSFGIRKETELFGSRCMMKNLDQEKKPSGNLSSRECMGMGVAGIIIDSYCGSFPKIPY